MKLSLKGIEFEDYRNIKNGERVFLEATSILVGANESGKSNVLVAINRLKSNFEPQDTKIGSDRKIKGMLPKLIFYLAPKDEELVNFLKSKFKNFEDGDLIGLVKDSDKFTELKLIQYDLKPKKQILQTHWKNNGDQELIIQTTPESVKLQPGKIIVGKKDNSLLLASLVRRKKLSRVPEEEISKEVIDKIITFIPDVESWKYEGKEQELYVPNDVVWEQFVADTNTAKSVQKLFLVAGKEDPSLGNFQQVLQGLQGQSTEIQNFLNRISKALNEVIKKTWSQSTLEFQLTYQTDKLRIDTLEGGELKPPDVRSEGVKWFLSFLLDFKSRGEELEGKILLLDQPGERLHPGGQKELLERFEELSRKNQIIYSTQSPFLVDRNNWSRVQFLKRLNGDTEIKTPKREDVENDELLRHSLGYTLADVGQANEFNVVVEGFTDKYLLLEWSKKFNEKYIKERGEPFFNLNSHAIFDKHGRGSIHKAVDELTQAGLIAIGLFDGDREGKSSLKEAKKDTVIGDYFLSFDEASKNKDCKTAEDLVPADILMEAVKKTFNRPKADKKILKKPRLTKIKSWYQKLFNKELDKEQKEKLWTKIIDLFEKSPVTSLDVSKHDEAKLVETMLVSANEKLAEIKEKTNGKTK